MARIPTPIPSNLARRAGAWCRSSLVDVLWRLLLLVVGGSIVYGALQNGGLLVSTVAGILLFVAISDTVSETARNVWNREFWIWET